MTRFPVAWCPELKRDIEPEEVRDICADTGRIPELRCPDAACRQEMPQTRIITACCDPRVECSRHPHFRTNPKHEHGKNCDYETWGKHTDYVLAHRDEFLPHFPESNLLRRINGIDTTKLPDAFVVDAPTEFVAAMREQTDRYMRSGQARDTATRMARCAVPHKTRRLSLVVSMAHELDRLNENIRQTVPLTLPGRAHCNYNNAFLMVTSLKHDYVTPYIFCGKGHVLEVNGNYIIKYAFKLSNYHPDYPDLPACTPINPDLHTAAFLNMLSEYAASGEPCYFYSFSTHALKESTCPMSDTKRCVVIEPRTRDCVVIRKRCLKREQNKTL